MTTLLEGSCFDIVYIVMCCGSKYSKGVRWVQMGPKESRRVQKGPEWSRMVLEGSD